MDAHLPLYISFQIRQVAAASPASSVLRVALTESLACPMGSLRAPGQDALALGSE